MPADRRATIAAALDASEDNNGQLPPDFKPPESPENPESAEPLVKEEPKDTPPEEETPEEPQPETQEAKAPVAPAQKTAEDKPPQSWRAAQKAKWSALDPEVKSEILRRERDHDKLLTESSSARQLVSAFGQVLQPYMARINSTGLHPIAAIHELLKADHLLNNGPAAQRAAYMANLISMYGIDIVELDKALAGNPSISGKPQEQNQIESTLNSLLDERLKPLHQFVQTQSQQEQQRRQQEAQMADQSVEQMAADNTKYPYFDDVRSDMADIIEIQAKKGVYLTLEQAYNRAVGMNPEVSQLVAQQQERSRMQSQHQRAKNALSASKSVNGSPGGPPLGNVDVKDRRATIAAAWDSLEGR